jgi:uncharacterized delta-60 repeat protein
MQKTLILFSFLLTAHGVFSQASGTLDATFGTGGRVVTSMSSANDRAGGVIVQADGKIVVAGTSYTYTSPYVNFIVLIRYNNNGTIDSTFGSNGKINTNFGAGNCDFSAMTIQTDGKIVITCNVNSGVVSNQIGLVRYKINGSLDSTFGINGKATLGFSTSTTGYEPFAITIQTDGKIVVTGGSLNGIDSRTFVARVNANGSSDTTFNLTGIVITDVDPKDDRAFSVAVQPDGKILVCGHILAFANSSVQFDMTLIRYNANGILDASFGTNGITIIKQGDGRFMKILNSGKILAGGQDYINTTGTNPKYDFLICRFNANGTLDSTFSSNGKLITPINAFNSFANAMLVQKDNKIVLAGSGTDATNAANFVMTRFSAEGVLDNTFGTSGKVIIPIASFQGFPNMTIQNDGKLLICGDIKESTKFNFITLRFNNTVNVGVKTIVKNNPLSIYPNPTKNELNIDVKDLIDCDFLIKISDLTGRIVYQNKYDKTLINKVLKININDLITGLYVLTIHSEKEIKSQLILKN